MLLFAVIAGTVSVLISWLVTAKLFALARQTGDTPERLLATAFTGLFGVGYPLATASRAPGLGETVEGGLLFAIAVIGIVAGHSALTRFPLAVFRPGCAWAEGLSATLILMALVTGTGSVVSVASASSRIETIATLQPWALALLAPIGLALLWNAIEATLAYRILKRRPDPGPTEKATLHRLFFWALASTAASLQVGALLAIRASGLPILAPLPMAVIAFHSLIAAACWWLAFFMPGASQLRFGRDVHLPAPAPRP